ncbi:MAG: response regulator transcription factor [Elusimicrobia bacterium]|nr:response regulator transcription factor [Elusimicrobiota bacterium]
MGYRLLAVGGDAWVLDAAKRACAETGHALEFARTGADAVLETARDRVDLMLVDLQLPDVNGLAWLKMLRQTAGGREVPVIALTGARSDAEMAEAYDWGADDYLEKGVNPAELAARIRAVLRRRFEREEQLGAPLALGPFALDPGRHEVLLRGRRIELRPREFELLEILMRKAGRVLSRPYLLESIWGMSRQADTRAVDVGISRLRLRVGPRAARWIETVERFGYRFRASA